MAEIIWTEPALANLEDIAEYIALHNVDAAKQLVQTVFNAVERLEKFPASGRKPPELAELEYREVIVNPCRIFYRVEKQVKKQKVFIVYVMRQEQLLRRYLLEGTG